MHLIYNKAVNCAFSTKDALQFMLLGLMLTDLVICVKVPDQLQKGCSAIWQAMSTRAYGQSPHVGDSSPLNPPPSLQVHQQDSSGEGEQVRLGEEGSQQQLLALA